MADSISIEETNKIRLAIGLKPLPVPGGGPSFKTPKDDKGSLEEEDLGSTLESRQAQGYDNWKKLQDEADAKAQREAKNEAIKKARDAARKFARLEGKGLGEADDVTELDTKTWLIQQKKRQKKLERERLRKLEQELAERENAPDHTAEDLAGVKVAHELNDFDEGDEQVLTLKDTTIDQNEEEGDELENLELKEREALNEKLQLKKKKPVYDPNDVNESGSTSILKHYDETIDGKKKKRFVLDAQGSTAEEGESLKQFTGRKLKAQPISLDVVRDDVPTSDYAIAFDGKIRKQKKKVKSRRLNAMNEDDIIPIETDNGVQVNGDSMEVDSAPAEPHSLPKRKLEGTSFVDDDDLQASLAVQRRAALKKRKRTKPEDIARQLREEVSATPGPLGDGEDDTQDGEAGLVIDETTEFVANLQRATEEKTEEEQAKSHIAKSRSPAAEDEADIDMDRPHNEREEEQDSKARIKREIPTPEPVNLTVSGLEEESTLDKGLGATVSLLTQRGLLKPTHEGDINALHRERDRFLTEKQKREAEVERKARLQRERDRASGKLDRMSAREREEHARWENKQRDQAESRQMLDVFNREYKPDVQLKYVDEFGRSMNQKEAFKHLSHQFHGKGSGKQKTEKHLKKIADDKKKEAQSTLDSSQTTGMNNAMGTTQKKNRQAGVRLA